MKKHTYIYTIIAFTALYILQFLIIPLVMPQYFPLSNSNEATGIYFVSLLIFLFVLELYISNKWKTWLIADMVYLVLMIIYHGNGHYGIGMAGFNLYGAVVHYDFQYALICIGVYGIEILILELLVKLITYFIRKFSKNNRLTEK